MAWGGGGAVRKGAGSNLKRCGDGCSKRWNCLEGVGAKPRNGVACRVMGWARRGGVIKGGGPSEGRLGRARLGGACRA